MRIGLGELDAVHDFCDLDNLLVQYKLDVLKSSFCAWKALLTIICKRAILDHDNLMK